MKYLICLSLLACAATNCISCIPGFPSKKMPEGKLCYYNYSIAGSSFFPKQRYTIEEDTTGKVTLTWTQPNTRNEITVTLADRSLLDSIQSVIEEEKAYKFKDNYKPLFDVQDGDSWSYEARFRTSDGKSETLQSHGYASKPDTRMFARIDSIVGEVGKANLPTLTDSPLVGYEYSSTGDVAGYLSFYKLETKGKKVVASYQNDERKIVTKNVGNEVLTKVKQMLDEGGAVYYKRHYSPDVDVCDGTSWDYMASFADETHLYSSGLEVGPGNNTLSQINDYIKSLFDK